MNLRVVFRPAARREFDDAADTGSQVLIVDPAGNFVEMFHLAPMNR